MIMKHLKYTMAFIAIIGIILIISQIDIAYSNSLDNAQYPIICESELGPLPKNLSFRREVDINSDGRIDIIANNFWGVRALYINCGNDQYYCAILCEKVLSMNSDKKSGWHSIYIIHDNVIIDGKLYKYTYLPFEYEKDGQAFEFNVLIEHDGISYKIPFSYCKSLEIYAPRYRFSSEIQIVEINTIQKVKVLDYEYKENSYCHIVIDNQICYTIGGVSFTDLNRDGFLDAILYYSDPHGSGDVLFGGLLLNDGSNNFIFVTEMILGSFTKEYPLKSQDIIINGKHFLAIVYKLPIDVRYDSFGKQNQYDLYIYQPELKGFIHLPALPGKDKSTFIPLDNKKFEDIVNPPLFRKDPSRIPKTDEAAILKLIEDYENALIKAINSNDFSIVEKHLTPGSNLYKAQKELVANLYKKGIQEKLIDHKVEKIETTAQANVYKVYVFEKIGIKQPGKPEFTASEFRWAYTVVSDNGKYTLSEIDKWDGE
jgi:hypothetical protein